MNWLANETASFLSDDSSSYSIYPLSILIIDNCRASWYQGLEELWQENFQAAEGSWQVAIPCDPLIVPILETLFSEQGELVARAVQHYPGHAEGWFWLAKSMSPSAPAQAIDFYRRGLELAPGDGLRWRELGDLLRTKYPHAEIDAYLQSCFNGDPGSNGCWRAGGTAEQLGELEDAIRYYSYSRWDGALNRAGELRAELEDSTQP